MKRLREISRVGIRFLNKLPGLLKGNCPSSVPQESRTLDRDDVRLARKWLRDRSRWNETDVVSEFESEFACWNGSQYAFAFMGGRVALSACIYALGLRPGDEVIVPGYTCIAVPNAFHFAGLSCLYCDIELDTFGPDIADVERKITPKTRAILIHHLYGLVCRDYELILELAQRLNLFIIEDCAQSTGAIYRDRKIGNRGDVGFYSCEQSKVFNTGQGGIAVTNDEVLAARMREFHNGSPDPDENRIENQLYTLISNYYEFKHPRREWVGDVAKLLYSSKRARSTTEEEEKGIRPFYYGQRMPPALADIALNQLKKIDRYNEERRKTAKQWDLWCERNGYRKAFITSDSTPVFLRYPVLVEPERKRNGAWAREELGVELGVWFVSHLHPTAFPMANCPNADLAVERCVNFPCLM
jgi:perosamine synthetase